MKVVREGLLSFISQVIDAFEQLVVTRGGDGDFTSSITIESTDSYYEPYPKYFLRISKPNGKTIQTEFSSNEWMRHMQISASVFCYEEVHGQKVVSAIFTYKIEEGPAAANNIALAIAYRSW